ncbi:MAG: Lrp/AsnC family transcriptional regulator [Pelagimonas sp.]|jgi:DNA-binding Lrp family transcriptional regulator
MKDEIDRKIITHLQANARASATYIANRMGIARTTVQDRISRMERMGVIEGYTVRLQKRPDSPSVQVLVMIEVTQKSTGKVVKALNEFPEVRKCLSINGDFDLCVSAEAPHIEDLDILVDAIGALPGVERTNTSVVFGTRIDRLPDDSL